MLAEPGEVSPDHPLVVVPAALAKGLEFDAVIVVEPAAIAEHEPHGIRLLFVALTRAVQHLAIAHSRDLPRVLGTWQWSRAGPVANPLRLRGDGSIAHRQQERQRPRRRPNPAPS